MVLFGKALSFGAGFLSCAPLATERDGGLRATAHDALEAFARLSISCPTPTQEDNERNRHRQRGRFLARQERWSDLFEEVKAADDMRAMTPAAMPIADLLSEGARSDVVSAVEHALIDGSSDGNATLLAGIVALEDMLADAPSDPIRTVFVAQTHMDLGWAWRRTGRRTVLAARHQEAFKAHFERARDILTGLGNKCADSPLFLSSLCALNANGVEPKVRLANQFERLIDLNPETPGPMRSMGRHLSPRFHGSHPELELEARRTAARTADTWGAGGYTWVMLDALANDPVALSNLDLEFFTEGLQDIMFRQPDQHTANTLAAYCAVTMGSAGSGDAGAEPIRAGIAACADWIVREHMTELHPMIWARAESGFDNDLPVLSARSLASTGRHNALHALAKLFRKEIDDGNRIVFTDDGPVAEHC